VKVQISISRGLLDDYAFSRLPDRAKWRALQAAFNGEESTIAEYVRRRIINRPDQAAWTALRSEVFARDDFTCAYCGERGGRLECDHVTPVSRGGRHDPDNLVAACFGCNRDKAGKTLIGWFAKRAA
jgi:5-methylcytosine-specific restriction endonuclease McrA